MMAKQDELVEMSLAEVQRFSQAIRDKIRVSSMTVSVQRPSTKGPGRGSVLVGRTAAPAPGEEPWTVEQSQSVHAILVEECSRDSLISAFVAGIISGTQFKEVKGKIEARVAVLMERKARNG